MRNDVESTWSGETLLVHLHELDDLLHRQAQWWRPQAFTYLEMPWEKDFPVLAARLRALPLPRSEQLAANENELADFLREFIVEAPNIQCAVNVPAFPTRQSFHRAEPRAVPGRKWQQLLAFAATLSPGAPPTLEWCAGKSHLGRLLAHHDGCTVTALEWNPELIADGQQLAQREKVTVNFHRVDVMSALALAYINGDQRVVALHACGDLHTQLLQGCAQKKADTLVLVPCCYHLTRDHVYRPLSRAGASNRLILARDDLRTAVQGSATSPARAQQQRKQLQAWRLGFDLLQRELRGSDDYLHTPSLPTSILRDGFAAFCLQVAQRKQLPLPSQLDYERYETAGFERLRLVAALDLPRLLFRRALELWLVLDRAVFLQESGYLAQVGTFCECALTPRNLMIQAHYRDSVA